MTRRQFLAHIGIGLLMVMGIDSLLKNLLHYGKKTDSVSDGYGSTRYGV